MTFRLLTLAIVTAALSGSAHGGLGYPTPPGDTAPTWSPDASAIVFVTERLPLALRVIAPDGREERPIPVPPTNSYAFSPDWRWIAYRDFSVAPRLIVMHPNGSDRRDLGPAGFVGLPSWSPDGRRLAVPTPDGISVVDIADGRPTPLVTRGAAPAWSPSGDRIAFLSAGNPYGAAIESVSADGTNRVRLTPPGIAAYSAPTWSPDGTRLLTSVRTGDRRPPRLAIIEAARRVVHPLRQSGHFGYAWSPSGDRLLLSGGGVKILTLRTGRVRQIAPGGADAAWSPDGQRVAFSAGGACRDRRGIYVAAADGATKPRRISNSCELRGTEGPDTVVGTPLADDILGLGGDDLLSGSSSTRTGDTLEGGGGDDILTGTQNADTLVGGAGADIIRGGPDGDGLTGGTGRDVFAGEGGADVVHARDGTRDVVSCGTNSLRMTSPFREADIAYVDRVDAVSRDCEYVYRPLAVPPRGKTALAIRVNPDATRVRPTLRTYTLYCNPAKGTLPNARGACARLAKLQNPFAPVPSDVLCAEIYGGPQTATVVGRYAGRPVRTGFRRTDGCQIARWNRVKFLFPIPVGASRPS